MNPVNFSNINSYSCRQPQGQSKNPNAKNVAFGTVSNTLRDALFDLEKSTDPKKILRATYLRIADLCQDGFDIRVEKGKLLVSKYYDTAKDGEGITGELAHLSINELAELMANKVKMFLNGKN